MNLHIFVKYIQQIYLPININMNAGSRAMLVRRLKLLNVSFSIHAQIPTAKMPNPSNYNKINMF